MKNCISILLFVIILLALTDKAFAQKTANQKTGNQRTADQKTADQKTGDGDEKEIVLEFKTQLVLVPFSVFDRTNKPVGDLKPEDVKLYENNQQAQIISLQRTGDSRLNFALMLDLSGSMQPHLKEARAAAYRFLDRALRPEKDRASVLEFQQDIIVAQRLTTDKAALKEAVERNYLTLETAAPSTDGAGKKILGTALYGALYVAADEVLRSVDGRRVIVLISDGFDSESGIEMRDALDYAWRREATIYAIGLGERAGLNTEVLEKLCSTTGGRAFYPKTAAELDSIFAKIDEDLREQYVLSFYPNARSEDMFRTIKIDIPSRPSLTINHRFGYYNAVKTED